MKRFALRHWTAILVVVALLSWALFYLPGTPGFAVLELKRAIDARNGAAAARYVDFESVVRHGAYEMVEKNDPNNAIGQMLGKGVVEVFAGPMAQIAKSWAEKEVSDGAKEVQMPLAAVLGALVLMHRNGATAYTRFRDNRDREWEVHMARDSQGVWQVSEVKNIAALLKRLRSREEESPSD